MIVKSPKRIRNIIFPGAFFLVVLAILPIHSMEPGALLTAPGLRPLADPSLVIPADFQYANQRIELPAYRDSTGSPAKGWSKKYVDTRRFASNQSAWIYFRNTDFERSVSKPQERLSEAFRFWPVGTRILIEIYEGTARQQEKDKLIEIAAMAKIDPGPNSFNKAFYPVSWTYSTYKPDGRPSITSARVRECHQCHGIAFHLTGDLIFTQFP